MSDLSISSESSNDSKEEGKAGVLPAKRVIKKKMVKKGKKVGKKFGKKVGKKQTRLTKANKPIASMRRPSHQFENGIPSSHMILDAQNPEYDEEGLPPQPDLDAGFDKVVDDILGQDDPDNIRQQVDDLSDDEYEGVFCGTPPSQSQDSLSRNSGLARLQNQSNDDGFFAA